MADDPHSLAERIHKVVRAGGVIEVSMEKTAELARLLQEAEAALRQMAAPGWRTIDSAPRDGTEILMFCPGISCWQRRLDGEVVIGRWEGKSRGAWYSDSSSSMEGYESTGDYVVHDPVFPTHWMPLPSAPTGETE